MKNHLLTLATLAVLGSSQLAHAQREAPDKAKKREQRAQQAANMTPEQLAQFRAERFQERLKSATPEQREKMLAAQAKRQNGGGGAIGGADAAPNAGGAVARGAKGAGRAGKGRAGGRGQGGAGAETGAMLSPAARDDARRALMNAAGITERPTQDAILVFLNAEEVARRPVLRLARASASSLWPFQPTFSKNQNGELVADKAPDAAATQAKIAADLLAYQSALATDKIRHQDALSALDAEISYSKNLRLQAFLSLVGVLDAETLALGGPATIFPPLPPQKSAT